MSKDDLADRQPVSAIEIQSFFEHVEEWIAYGVDAGQASVCGAAAMRSSAGRVQARIEQLEREQQWLAEVGPPKHPDDERHWAMAYVQERRRAERAERELAKAKRDAASEQHYMFHVEVALANHAELAKRAVRSKIVAGPVCESICAAIDSAMQEPRDA